MPEYTLPPNTDTDSNHIIRKYQELGSQSKENAIGDKNIGKKPQMINQEGGNKQLKMKGGKCNSFSCPQISYNSGSSLEQANQQLSEEHTNNVNNVSKMNGIAPPKGGSKKISKEVQKKIYSYNIMRSKKKILKKVLKGGKTNYPVDKGSLIPPEKQWFSSKTSAPEPSYNGGLYGASINQKPDTAYGPQAIGPWGTVDVTPTTTEFIRENLNSANPPPGANKHYPSAGREGNNFTAVPEINWYNDTSTTNTGPFEIQGVLKGGNKKHKSKLQKKKNKSKSKTKRKYSKKKGGLALLSKNMDCGDSFHPKWDAKFQANETANPPKKGGNKKQKGGLALLSKNMDCGDSFHPKWDAKFNQKNTSVQDGGKKK